MKAYSVRRGLTNQPGFYIKKMGDMNLEFADQNGFYIRDGR